MRKYTILSIAVSSLTLTACLGTGDATDAPSDGGGTVSFPSTLLGERIRCETFGAGAGTALNGKVFGNTFELRANGTYSYGIYLSSATTCLGGTGAGGGAIPNGGEDVFRFDQQGTYTTSGPNNDGSWNITMTPTAQQFTARNFGSMGPAMVTAVNTNCSPSPNLSGASTTSIGALTCGSSSPDYIVPNTPSFGVPILNIIKVNGSGFYLGTRADVFTIGNTTTRPTSATVSWDLY